MPAHLIDHKKTLKNAELELHNKFQNITTLFSTAATKVTWDAFRGNQVVMGWKLNGMQRCAAGVYETMPEPPSLAARLLASHLAS
ncbi:hypothetical protein CYMTET_27920 [Cymbomonas tetramitiformis]|uniref:Uncharacterized protein n=1 Tax=Cymbomonas tetramitiformis TaxID=36881 RepID=A0AAE0FPF0_9CHLO|nr:hypothetical protein CYMTET_27920 [Cymbomonas tetramitiformis]